MNPILKYLLYTVLAVLLPAIYKVLVDILPVPLPISDVEFTEFWLALIGGLIGGWNALKGWLSYHFQSGLTLPKWYNRIKY